MSLRSCSNCFRQNFRIPLNRFRRSFRSYQTNACSHIFRIHCLSRCVLPFPLSQPRSTSTFSYVLSPSLSTLLFLYGYPVQVRRMPARTRHIRLFPCRLHCRRYVRKRIRTSHIHHLSIHELQFLLSQLRNRCISSCAVFLLSPILDFLYERLSSRRRCSLHSDTDASDLFHHSSKLL